jgi:molybdenum cofactor cytidylyltransferase
VAAVPEAIAVVRSHDLELAHLLERSGARIVECARADEGMGASLACGVSASADAGGWIVALADMPWIEPATIALVACAIAAGAELAAPSYRGERGHPVGFSRRYHAQLAALSGDQGARAILAANADRLTLIATSDAGTMRDVDRPDQI